MTATREAQTLSRQEMAELDRLFHQIKTSLTICSVEELESFTDKFTRSLIGKADDPDLQFAVRE